MNEQLLDVLAGTFGLTYDQIADALWLAPQLPRQLEEKAAAGEALETGSHHATRSQTDTSKLTHGSSNVPAPEPPDAPASVQPAPGELFVLQPGSDTPGSMRATPVRVPGVEALPNKQAINAAARPLKRRFPSTRSKVLDVTATVEQIANGGPAVAVLKPTAERWLEVALVVDESASMRVWREVVREFGVLLERHGSFRDVRSWYVSLDEAGLKLYGEPGLPRSPRRLRNPKELIDPSARRLILVITDCVAPGWYDGAMFHAIREWGLRGPLALIQVLPERLWGATALGTATTLLRASLPGAPNALLDRLRSPWNFDSEPGQATTASTARSPRDPMPLPVFNLAGWSVAPWAKLVAKLGDATAEGVTVTVENHVNGQTPLTEGGAAETSKEISPGNRVTRFRETASAAAKDLAGYLAAVPLCLPVMRLVQKAMLPIARQVDLAEVLLSGLMKPLTGPAALEREENLFYEFFPGVRELLLASVKQADQVRVLRAVSRLIESQTGHAIDFAALLTGKAWMEETQGSYPIGHRFARIAADVLSRLNWPGARNSREKVVQPSPAPTGNAAPQARSRVPTRFHPGRVIGSVTAQGGVGTVYFISPALGITATHFGLDRVGVTARIDVSGRTLQARLVATDPDHDVAILKLDTPLKNVRPFDVTFLQAQAGTRWIVWGSPGAKVPLQSVAAVVTTGSSAGALIALDTESDILPGMSGAPVADGTLVIGHVVSSHWGSGRRLTLAAPGKTVCDLVTRYGLQGVSPGDRHELWHPAVDSHTRDDPTPCRLSLAPNAGKPGRHRLERWGDLRVRLIDGPDDHAVYLLPSRFAPLQFQDSRDLTPSSDLLREKQSLGIAFVQAFEGKSFEGLWFYKIMSSGKRHLHAYAPAYDEFLATRHGARSQSDLFAQYAERYEDLRASESPGSERTQRMNSLVSEISREARRHSLTTVDIQRMFDTGADGFRLVALACCIVSPIEAQSVLIEALRQPRSPFEQWCALLAIEAAVGRLDAFLSEPYIATVLQALDDRANFINATSDGSRRQLAQGILNRFAQAVGFRTGEGTSDQLRLWMSAAAWQPEGGSPNVVIFGSDTGGHSHALCVALGQGLARAGWKLKIGISVNVGVWIASEFGRINPDSVTLISPSPAPSGPFRSEIEEDRQRFREKLIEGADCAIVISGGTWTRVEYDMAMSAGLPVLAIGSTGGTAAKLAQARDPLLRSTNLPESIVRLIDIADKPETQTQRILRVAALVLRNRKAASPPPWISLGELRGHSNVILHVSWHPSGARLATTSVDTTARIWEVSSQRELLRLTGYAHGVNQASWSPDAASRLATCSFDGTIRIWSAQDGSLIQKIGGHSEDVRDVAWSPDGHILASASSDRSIALWNAQTGTRLAVARRAAGGEVRRIFWVDTHNTMVSCWQDGKVCLFDSTALESGPVREVQGPGRELIDLAYSAQRQVLAACSSGGIIRIWTWPDLAVATDLRVGRGAVRSVSFSADGRFLAANTQGRHGEVRIWETQGWSEVSRISEPTSSFWPCNIAWAPTGLRLASLGRNDSLVRLWDLQETQLQPPANPSSAARPPAPGPIRHADDLQKGRWGGKSQRDGRSLEVVLKELEHGAFHFDASVTSVDGSTLAGPVLFHLHDTFNPSVIHVAEIREGTRAVLEDVSSYGIFTIGAQVKSATGSWIGLEWDLTHLPGLPERFRRQ